jgi:hypothetical protein
LVWERAKGVINGLAAQLGDQELKAAFLDSPLATEIHAAFKQI